MPWCVPEAWTAGIDEGLVWTAEMLQALRSGKNLGRKIFAALIVMAVVSLFVKVSFMSGHVDVIEGKGKVEKESNGLLILQSFKDESALAQRVVSESQNSMPKRVLEFSVSTFFKKLKLLNFY